MMGGVYKDVWEERVKGGRGLFLALAEICYGEEGIRGANFTPNNSHNSLYHTKEASQHCQLLKENRQSALMTLSLEPVPSRRVNQ
jgi:hypothetical protein